MAKNVTAATVNQIFEMVKPGQAAHVRDEIVLTFTGTNTGTFSIERRTETGDWVAVTGQMVGTTTSWTDTTAAFDSYYRYRTAGPGGGGSIFGPTYTTPPRPATVKAVRLSATQVRIEATGLAKFAEYEISDNLGSFSTVYVPSLPATINANSGIHGFVVRARVTSPTVLNSPTRSAPAISAVQDPQAPTGLTPSGTGVRAGAMGPFGWTPVHPDGSLQASATPEYRLIGAPSWTSWGTVSGSTPSFSPAVPSAPGQYEWRVATKGINPTSGPYSAPASFNVLTAPVVSIISPTSLWTKAALLLSWSSSQAQSYPQAEWQAELVQGTTVLETRTDTGNATSTTFDQRVNDGGSYKVRLRTSHGGVWSDWVEQTITVAYTKPAMPTATATWNDDAGFMELVVAAGAGGGGTPATIRVSIERSCDSGVTWEIVSELGTSYTLHDFESLSDGVTKYRVIAWTADGATETLAIDAVATSNSFWLATGDRFEQAVRLPFEPVPKLTPGRERSTFRYAGRTKPLAYAGEGTSLDVSVTGILKEREIPGHVSALIDQMIAIAQAGWPVHLLRGPVIGRIYGSISPIDMPRQSNNGTWEYSFSLEETSR